MRHLFSRVLFGRGNRQCTSKLLINVMISVVIVFKENQK